MYVCHPSCYLLMEQSTIVWSSLNTSVITWGGGLSVLERKTREIKDIQQRGAVYHMIYIIFVMY